jgi:prolyl oligopeptidase
MVAKMSDMGHKVYYYENTEGGHGGGANLNQRAYTSALSYAYLWKMLR